MIIDEELITTETTTRPKTPELSSGWVWTNIGSLFDVTIGGTPSRQNEEYWNGEIAWVSSGEVAFCRITSSRERITSKGLVSSNAKLHPPNTVLLAMIGEGKTRGQAAILGIPATTNQNIAAILCAESPIPAEWVFLWLMARYDQTRRRGSGGMQQALNSARVREITIPIAPLAEQQRIVAEIEKQFTRLDAGVASLKRAQANLKRYKAAVLKAACEGKLVPQDPSDEPASELLKRILAERCPKWADDLCSKGKDPRSIRYEEPTPPNTKGLPELPPCWCWASVDQLSIVVRGASPRPAGDPRYFGGTIPWITVGSLTADDQPYLTTISEFVTEQGKAASRYIEPETLLLTNSGATLGVPKIIKIGGCINDGSVALLHVGYPLKLYLYYYLSSITKKLRTINQGAAQPNLNTGIVKAIVVPLPPESEQVRIVAELERRLSVVRELEAIVAANLKRAERLRQSILKRAFEGKLVPQDPSDEPASELLTRIRQERQQREKQTREKPTNVRASSKAKPGAGQLQMPGI